MNRRILPLSLLLAFSLANAAPRLSAAEPAIQKRAFLVGVAKYEKDGLPNLAYSEDDMRELGQELAKHGFTVTTVLGPDATRAKLTTALDQFVTNLGDLKKTDVALIAFSGHGVQKQTARDGRNDEDAFFCPVDALKDNPDTMISIGLLMDQLQSKSGSSQNLVLVDACRNNPSKGAKGIDGSTARNLGNKISVLFSSTNGQQSFESKKVKHAVFTHVLLEGLRGEARDVQGRVTWLNLASYVMDAVPVRAPELLDDPNAEQQPNLIGNLVRQPVLARIEIARPSSNEEARKRADETQKLLDEQRKDSSPPVSGAPEITNSIGMKLKLIHAGEFIMGSSPYRPVTKRRPGIKPDAGYPDEIDPSVEKDEQPPHKVHITRPFYLGMYEVTRGEFAKFANETRYQTDAEKFGGGWGWNEKAKKFEGPMPGYSWRTTGFHQTGEHPVLNVSWNDATAFVKWLSQKEGAEYRLPTEAEWEYACRGGATSKWSSGDDPEKIAEIGNIADGSGRSKFRDWTWAIAARDNFVFTAPVGSFRANGFGLFDMHGNAWEMCRDYYSEGYYGESPPTDPLGAVSGNDHVVRGGGWFYSSVDARASNRLRYAPLSRDLNTGFRVARNP